MKQILVAVMAALLLVGCQQSDTTSPGTDTGGTTTTNAPAGVDTNAPAGGTQ